MGKGEERGTLGRGYCEEGYGWRGLRAAVRQTLCVKVIVGCEGFIAREGCGNQLERASVIKMRGPR